MLKYYESKGISVDELTHFSKTNYEYIFTRVRKLAGSNIPLKIRGASNPPDEGQGVWVYDRFVNPKTKEDGVVFLPAGMDDNPFLDKDSYTAMFKNVDPVTRARLLDGQWTIKRSGNMFKREWFETVDNPPIHRRRVRAWDLAAAMVTGKTKDPDYTVGALVSEYKGVFYIEDITRARKRPEETERLQGDCAKSDGRRTMIREEQEPGSSGIGVIDSKARSVFKGYNYKGVRTSGNKINRAEIFSAASERGHVKIVRGCRNVDDMFDELEVFPTVAFGIHDDIVDAISLAVSELGASNQVYEPMEITNPMGSYWNNDTFSNGDSFEGWRGSGF